ncbi:MAG: hypothetical protein RJA59_1845, partial [Pseudomonadota bacterium]
MTPREYALKLAAQFGLSPEETATVVSRAATMQKMSVDELQVEQKQIIAAPFAPGARRGPIHSAMNSMATFMLATTMAENLPPGPGRESVLVGAGLAQPSTPVPEKRLVEVSKWHIDVKRVEERRQALRAKIDNRTLAPEIREAAR